MTVKLVMAGKIFSIAKRKLKGAFSHVQRIAARLRINRGIRRKVDAAYRVSSGLASRETAGVILADGIWDNPNHFFRLSLYLKAIDPQCTMQRVAMVPARASGPQRRTLSALGFTRFIELPAGPAPEFVEAAARLLKDVRSHGELLQLRLPDGLPPYIFYDDALKRARHPQPEITAQCWKDAVAQALSVADAMRKVFDRENILHVVLSHPWGLPYGPIAWSAISRKVATCHLTGYGEGIRIRRFESPEAYQLPVEHLSYEEYLDLPLVVQSDLVDIGQLEFERRSMGRSSDINSRCAFNGHYRQAGDAARKQWVGSDTRPVVLICSHVWFDFPHTFAMRNFTDFLDWISFTFDQIKDIHDVVWLLKAHPTEQWYGGFQLSEVAPQGRDHIVMLPHDFDQATALAMCEVVVTAHGTAGIEAGIVGRPVICADRSYYSDWPFVNTARNRGEYARLLHSIRALPKATHSTLSAAAACFAAALAQPNEIDQRIKLRCDSLTNELYADLVGELLTDNAGLVNEQRRMRQWLASESGSYAVYSLIEGIKQRHAPVIGHPN
jgi:hypothetical protein